LWGTLQKLKLNLISCKCTRIEIYGIVGESLQLILEFPINGNVAAAQLFRTASEKQDSLFISTQNHQCCILAYDSVKGEIATRWSDTIHTANPLIPRSEIGQRVIIDPYCQYIGIYSHIGRLTLLPIDIDGSFGKLIHKDIDVFQVIDIQFLYGYSHPTFAILYQNFQEDRHIRIYEIQYAIFNEILSHPINVERGAEFIIALPLGGYIVIGEQSISYINSKTRANCNIKPTRITAHCLTDNKGQKIILSDYLGRLYSLVLSYENSVVTNMRLDLLGMTNPACTISHLNNDGLMFIGSSQDDSQLIKLENMKDVESDSFFSVLENYTNIGPIRDFCVVDSEREGQGFIVTCSGGFPKGTLRIIRNGVGVEEFAQIELPGIKGIWSLTPPEGSTYEKYLIVSFIGETKILAMGEDLEETEISGFALNQQSLFCGNVVANQYIQITSKGIYILSVTEQNIVARFDVQTESRIHVCGTNQGQVAIALKGTELCLFEIAENSLKQINTKTMSHDIACISIDPLNTKDSLASLCAVGLWDITVRILIVPSLQEIRKVEIGGEIIPRSLMFKTFIDTYLFIALGDGNLISWKYNLNTAELEGKKHLSIGTRPVILNQFKSTQIFACSDRPVIIHQAPSGKLIYSNINMKVSLILSVM